MVVKASAIQQCLDTELFSQYRAGDDAAFQELYGRHRDALYHHARSILRDDASAEDAVHASFLELFRAGNARRAASNSLGPFLHQVLRRWCIDRLRSDKAARCRERQSSRPWVQATDPGPDSGQLTDLNRALGELPSDQLEVLVLHVYSGMTLQETAEIAGVSINTAASRYRYALKKLSERMGDGHE